MKRELERIEIPGEHEARERAWEVVRRAYAGHEAQPRGVRLLRPLLIAGALAAVLAAAASPPGRAVIADVREAIGVVSADEALFDLPAPGRLLVTSEAGAWVVDADGGKRRLGDYDDAAWSPFGKFVAVSRDNEIAALSPDGEVEWTLNRPKVRFPRWGGSRTDTRIAYLSGDELRVVPGDGTGDKRLVRAVDPVAPAWRPEALHVLAYAAGGRIVVVDADTGRRLWSRRAGGARHLEWSRDGVLLLVQGRRLLQVYDARGRFLYDLLGEGAAPITAATFSSTNAVAFAQEAAGRAHLWTIPRLRPDGSAARELFSGPGRFSGLAWSPDGRWLLVGWREPNQWLFVRADGSRRVRAVAGISAQFDSRTPPRIEGWVEEP